MKKMRLYGLWWLCLSLVTPLWANESPPQQQQPSPPAFALPPLDQGKVMMPWDELKHLLEQLETLKQSQRETAKKPVIQEPPALYSLTEALLTGTVQEHSARFEASLSIQVLTTDWVIVPIFPVEVGVESLTLHPDPASTEFPTAFTKDKQGYALLTKGPQRLTLKAVIQVPITETELTYHLTFAPPKAVVNQVQLHIPEKGVQLLQTPQYSQIETADSGTTLKIVPQDTLKLAWRIEKDSSLSRKSSATLHTLISVNPAELLMSAHLELEHVTDLDSLALRLPTGVEIINLTSPDIERWSSQKDDQKDSTGQLIKIAGPAHSPLKLDLSYRLKLATALGTVSVPMPTVEGVETLEGFAGVEVLGNLEATTPDTTTTALAIPPKNLPKEMWQRASSPLLYGWAFHQAGFSPQLTIRGFQEIQTVIANADWVESVTLRTLEGRSMTRVSYAIRNNDRQFLTVSLPKDSHIWQAFLDDKPVKPAQKDSGEILIPMKKSAAQGDDLQSFRLELGFVTDVSKLSLKGDLLNQLPAIDIPISYLRWSIYLPEYYEYSHFEGPLKRVNELAPAPKTAKSLIEIPLQGQVFHFEKHLVVSEMPYVRGKYGQFLGDDILLSVPMGDQPLSEPELRQQVIPNRR